MEKKNKIITIIGRKGSGKSFYANRISYDLERVIIADSLNEYKGGHIFLSYDEFSLRIFDLIERKKFRIICKFSLTDDYDQLFDICFKFYNFTLLIDEADLYGSSHVIMPTFRRLISYGRHRAINLILISRRPYDLHPLIRSQTDEWIIFKTTEERDLGFIADLGIDPEKISHLKLYEYFKKINE